MKTKNNKELNKVFLIMSVFAIAALVAGIEMGYNIRESLYNQNQTETVVDTTKAIIAEDNTIYEAMSPKLTIVKTLDPASMYYDITNVSQAEVYIEKAIVNIYNSDDIKIYSTDINIYKTYLPGEADRLEFQVPQDPNSIAQVEIEFE